MKQTIVRDWADSPCCRGSDWWWQRQAKATNGFQSLCDLQIDSTSKSSRVESSRSELRYRPVGVGVVSLSVERMWTEMMGGVDK
jgi:hypothetical protein